ncbi:MAG TPA: CHASE3 domain-containing protein, partial [Actinomycetospora sp.]|nr:CHASE3 domain-containing protein [Actinomycetospora sp.]
MCSLTGVLVGLVVVIAFVAGLAQSRVADGVTQLAADTLPAHRETRALITASLDQETGQRGYLLLGDPSFLAPYHAGQEVEADAVAALAELHRDDPAANAQLAAATSTLTAWHREVAEPTIAARGAGPVPTEQLQAAERRGTELFDMLRQRLAALEEHTVTQQRAQLDAVVAAQRAADLVVVATAV